MQPNVALSYNSNGGNSYVGVGFSLSGFSSIHRCDLNYSDDRTKREVRFDAADRFCLNGLRLVAISGNYGADGAEYRTFPDTFAKVISHGGSNDPSNYTGPQSFTVYRKDGRIDEFGLADASVDVGTVTDVWSIKSTRDRSGNTMDFSYDKVASATNTEEHYPHEIRYGGHASGLPHDKLVRFEYVDRDPSDIQTLYRLGWKRRISKLLQKISLVADNGQSSVRSYVLSYVPPKVETPAQQNHRALLRTITECTLGACKRPTVLEWENAQPGFEPPRNNGVDMPPESESGQLVIMDVDGDGRDDMVFPDKEKWNIVFGAPKPSPHSDGGPLTAKVRTSAPSNDPLQAGRFQRGFPIDYNQDGKTDLLLTDLSSSWRYLRSTGNDFELVDTGIPRSKRALRWKYWMGAGGDGGDLNYPRGLFLRDNLMTGFYLVDLNGDGIKDLLERTIPDDSGESIPYCQGEGDYIHICKGQWRYRLHDGITGFGGAIEIPELDRVTIAANLIPMDVDGDGKEEVVFDPCQRWWHDILVSPIFCGDVGDGAPMFKDNGHFKIMSWQKNAGDNNGTMTFTDSGFGLRLKADGEIGGPGQESRLELQQTVVAFDVNGDGLKDLLASNLGHRNSSYGNFITAETDLWINTGKGFVHADRSGLEGIGLTASHLQHSLVLDYDGDGREDLLVPYNKDGALPPGVNWFDDNDKEAYRKFFLVRSESASTGALLSWNDIGLPYENTPWTVGVWPTRQGPRIGDVDGDGLQDLISEKTSRILARLHVTDPVWANRVKTDAITSITDGRIELDQGTPHIYGHVTTLISYAPLVATPGSPNIDINSRNDGRAGPYYNAVNDVPRCAYPCKRFVGSKFVVSQTRQDTGSTIISADSSPGEFNPSAKNTHYFYEDGYVDRLGRGWLGFRARTEFQYDEERTGATPSRWTRTIYDPTFYDSQHRNYPKVGWPTFTLMFGDPVVRPGTPRDVWLSLGETTSAAQDTNLGTTYFVRLLLQKTDEYETLAVPPQDIIRTLNPRLLVNWQSVYRSRTTDIGRVDDLGNPLSETTTTAAPHASAGQSKTTKVVSYLNDTSSWIIGRPRGVTITDETPEGTQVRQGETFYDPATGLANRSTIAVPTDDVHWLDTNLGRDRFGNVVRTTVSDANGFARQTVVTYEPDGTYPHAIRNALGQTTYTKYNPYLGLPIAAVDPNGLHVWMLYDAFGNLMRERRPDGSSTSYWLTRDKYAGEWLFTQHAQDTTGATSATMLDRLGRPFQVRTRGLRGQQTQAFTEYWAFGGVRRESLPFAASAASATDLIQYAYDNRLRLEKVTAPDGVTTAHRYVETTEFTTDGYGKESSVVRDGRGHVIRSDDRYGLSTTYGYGPFGALRTIIDPKGNKIAYTVDSYGRITESSDPDLGTQKLVYDAFGLPIDEIDSKGQETAYCHDALGRLTTQMDDDGKSVRTYDQGSNAIGRLTAATGTDGIALRFDYDSVGRASKTTTLVPTSTGRLESFVVERSYNTREELHRVTYPGANNITFAADYLYDDYGNQTVIQDGSDHSTLWHWDTADEANRVTRVQLGNGLSTSRTYYPSTGSLHSLVTAQANADPLQSVEYSYDQNRNLKTRFDHRQNQTETFSYDAVDRLLKAETSSGRSVYEYKYDEIGNIKYKSGVGDYTYDATNKPHAVRGINGRKYDYDKNGNQITRPAGPDSDDEVEVEYTAFYKPRSMRLPNSAVKFEYDAYEQRVRKTSGSKTTTYIEGIYERTEDRSNGTVEYRMQVNGPDGAFAIVNFTRGRTGDVSRKVQYVHSGHDGSVDLISNDQGGIVERRSYDPFGQRRNPDWATGGGPTAPRAQSLGFTGQEDEDDIGLVNMKGRMYDPRIGRFLSADPFVQEPTSSQSLNRYSYVLNNPLSLVDPTGYQSAPAGGTVPMTPTHVDIDYSTSPITLTIFARRSDEKADVEDKASGTEYGNRTTQSVQDLDHQRNMLDTIRRLPGQVARHNYDSFRGGLDEGLDQIHSMAELANGFGHLGLAGSFVGRVTQPVADAIGTFRDYVQVPQHQRNISYASGAVAVGIAGLFVGGTEAKVVEEVAQIGGSYSKVKAIRNALNIGGEIHHMPAWASIEKAGLEGVTHGNAPAIWMSRVDHLRTSTWGAWNKSKAFRAEQKALIEQGRFLDALKMDVDAVRATHGAKYDGAIQQMGEYIWELGQKL
ncbi:FG-GAP-like repeat-containing protein [Pendulispora brunnea]|uniref:FG-GAP-like repeat-containing protein n=2 Tax=Pendulispora brunnea TaxID=2905690 RepID=A0ABZ2K6Q1_9BACT